MLYNLLFRPRRILFFIGLTTLFMAFNYFYSNSSITSKNKIHSRSFDRVINERKINYKVVEINDRQPSYKLYVYERYDIDVDRKRAQAKLLDNIKLHDKCQQNPKTIVLDVGASLGIKKYNFEFVSCEFKYIILIYRTIWFVCCSLWMSSLYV